MTTIWITATYKFCLIWIWNENPWVQWPWVLSMQTSWTGGSTNGSVGGWTTLNIAQDSVLDEPLGRNIPWIIWHEFLRQYILCFISDLVSSHFYFCFVCIYFILYIIPPKLGEIWEQASLDVRHFVHAYIHLSVHYWSVMISGYLCLLSLHLVGS